MKTKVIKNTLKKLKNEIFAKKEEIYKALAQDLNKSINEVELTEILPIINEINYYLRNLNKWAKPKKVSTPLSLAFGKSYIYHKPYGTVVILTPWNYPFNLSFIPIINAYGAGNNVLIKLPERVPNTSQVISNIIKSVFQNNEVDIINGGVEEINQAIDNKADFVFFTGSQRVGNLVYQRASKKMIPCILELGGKNPTIITSTANIKSAAWNILFSKIMNAGQTCLAPDHLYIHSSIKEQFIKEINESLNLLLSKNLDEKQLARVVDGSMEQRLINFNSNLFSPEVLQKLSIIEINENDKLMSEEIFGPILPYMIFDDLDKLVEQKLMDKEKPLAIYLYSNNKKDFELIQNTLDTGSLIINSNSKFIYNSKLPFGGIKQSGIGRYHGKTGFETFSYEQIVYKGSKIQFISSEKMTDILISKEPHWIIKLINKLKKSFNH
ncbi:aldehyde dehydrogenase family protein [Mycoplasmopsis verecunda]|uniref:Aldehyde dehydrogenase n=1 Tax=Mycoplasmopsis verecunda TaxID=171291 RepID=A0A1T4LR87_9BACT|nr:aldehyde dehydrogenase family protein [Mycoplasmopsis verecunda]WPB54580.1 aldehyde dehydrogenase family protein [Mycoplasmopsis verecunda]SJZ57136.1 aldehyde dehydrogenase (NAD+) [Mycoplasmopsis verecunda]